MRTKYPISQWQFLKYSDDRIGLECVKEWLFNETQEIYKIIQEETEQASRAGVKPYLIQIFKNKLEERKKFLRHLLDEVQHELKELK